MSSGALQFSRFAYPPNELGYCGPDDTRALLEYVDSGTTDPGLHALGRAFDGAWPYLETIAASAHVLDPFDAAVVEAYWIGNNLLGRVDPAFMLRSLDNRFRRRAGPHWAHVASAIPAGAVPHHSFHVFLVYPWVGLLRSGARDRALRVLDRCRIRTGEIISVDDHQALVRTRPLQLLDDQLVLGTPTVETATTATAGCRLVDNLQPGDHVAMHWDWVCERLTTKQQRRLLAYNQRHLDLANQRLARSTIPA